LESRYGESEPQTSRRPRKKNCTWVRKKRKASRRHFWTHFLVSASDCLLLGRPHFQGRILTPLVVPIFTPFAKFLVTKNTRRVRFPTATKATPQPAAEAPPSAKPHAPDFSRAAPWHLQANDGAARIPRRGAPWRRRHSTPALHCAADAAATERHRRRSDVGAAAQRAGAATSTRALAHRRRKRTLEERR
jgi:hypothetical protein